MAKRPASKNKRNKILYRCCCEGLQEKEYFCRLKSLINEEAANIQEVDFKIVNVGGGNPLAVAQRVTRISLGDAEGRIAVFDYDLKEVEYKSALEFCMQQKIMSAYSNYNFDLWLLLHKQFCCTPVAKGDGYQKRIRDAYNLQEDADIKSTIIIKKICEQISLDDVKRAIKHAERIDEYNESHGALKFMVGDNKYYDNPHLGMHNVIRAIFECVSKK